MEKIIEELETLEKKHRKLYDDKTNKSMIFDGFKADALSSAIYKLKEVGLKDTYKYFKQKRDQYAQQRYDKLSANLAEAYGLVVGKLWKHYKKIK